MGPDPAADIADVYDEGAASYAEHWAPVLQGHARDLVDLVPPTAADQGRIREEVDAAGAPPFQELPRSDGFTDCPARMLALLEPAGFTDITTTARPLDAQFDAVSALAMRTGSGNLGWRFRRLTPSAQAQVRQRVAARLAALGPDAFLDRSEVQLTAARRTRPDG